MPGCMYLNTILLPVFRKIPRDGAFAPQLSVQATPSAPDAQSTSV